MTERRNVVRLGEAPLAQVVDISCGVVHEHKLARCTQPVGWLHLLMGGLGLRLPL